MLEVEMLLAGHGDALLVSYGGAGKKRRRILVDGGPWYAYDHRGGLRRRLHALLEAGEPEIELLVVTHVDTDHIDGVIRLLQDPALDKLVIKDIWFNGWKHLQPKARGVLAGKHGEYLGALLGKLRLPWNNHRKLAGGPVWVPPDGKLPRLELDGEAEVTLLSPGPAELDALAKEWPKSLGEADFRPGDAVGALEQLAHRARYGPPKAVMGSREDDSPANASSIALILSHGTERILLAGDASKDVLAGSLERLAKEEGEVPKVRDFKLAHHGSFGNQSRRLIKSVRTRRYLISSSSAYYGHPDDTTIRLILKHDVHEKTRVPELVFNYLSPSSKKWANPPADAGYTTSFPSGAVWTPPKQRRE